MKYLAHDEAIGVSSINVQECDVPSYNKNKERLIKVESSACNRADLLQVHGKYPPPKGVTKILGLECAGYLVDPDTDEVTDKKVMALLSGGGFS